MTVTERQRLDLVKDLEEALGARSAATLMEYLPASGWRDVATTTDLEHVRLAMRSDVENVHTTLGAEIENVRTTLGAEIRDVRTTLGAEISDVRTTLSADMRTGFAEVRADVARQFQRMTIAYVGGLVSFGGLLVAAASINRP